MEPITFPYTHCQFGVAVRDVTPPVGIYARSWGAAAHDVAEGVHRPCTVSAALFAPIQSQAPLLALVALDIGWFQYQQDLQDIFTTVERNTGLKPPALLINMSHTHSSTNANSTLNDRPGFELVKPYLARVGEQISATIEQARKSMRDAWIAYGYGRCSLAANRDLWDESAQQYACGFNPNQPADDTVLVGRVSDHQGRVLATLVNYACHPTTLAWQNRLLSPDYIGGVRDVLEKAFSAPALFLQGASGDLGPREGYVGDPAVADRNGRQLGYAAASAIEALPPAASQFVYEGIVRSGADLGIWSYKPCSASDLKDVDMLSAEMQHVDLPLKELPTLQELESKYETEMDRVEKEKLLRRRYLRRALGDGNVQHMPYWIWRLGDAIIVAIPNEIYSKLQQALRSRFPKRPLWVLCTTNGSLGYLPTREMYGTGIYQEKQTPYAPGCLERTIEAIGDQIAVLTGER